MFLAKIVTAGVNICKYFVSNAVKLAKIAGRKYGAGKKKKAHGAPFFF